MIYDLFTLTLYHKPIEPLRMKKLFHPVSVSHLTGEYDFDLKILLRAENFPFCMKQTLHRYNDNRSTCDNDILRIRRIYRGRRTYRLTVLVGSSQSSHLTTVSNTQRCGDFPLLNQIIKSVLLFKFIKMLLHIEKI